MRKRFKTKRIFERISLASRGQTTSSKGTRREKFRRLLAIESLESRRLLTDFNVTLQTSVNNGFATSISPDGYYETTLGIEKIGGGVVAYRPSKAGNGATNLLPSESTNYLLSQAGNALLRDRIPSSFINNGTPFPTEIPQHDLIYSLVPGSETPIRAIAGGSYIRVNETVLAPLPAGSGPAGGESKLYYTSQYFVGGFERFAASELNEIGSVTGTGGRVGRSTGDENAYVDDFGGLTFHNNQLYYFATQRQYDTSSYVKGLFVLGPGGTSGLVQAFETGDLYQRDHYFAATTKPVSTSVGLLWWGGDETTGVEPHIGGNLLKDIFPGPASSGLGNIGTEFWDVGGTVYFTANDGEHGYELWKTNGFGAQLVVDAKPGMGSGGANGTTNVSLNGQFVFTTDDGVHGPELWVTDNTTNGAHLILDLNPGIGPGIGGNQELYQMGGSILFAGNNGSGDVELWQTDGSAAGTSLVANILASGSSTPERFQKVGNDVFFSAASRLYNVSLGNQILPQISITTIQGSATEGGQQNLVFRVSRTGSNAAALLIGVSIGGTSTSSDYTINRPVGFAAGQSSFDITVSPVVDTDVEPTESVVISIANRTSYRTSGSAVAFGFISDANPGTPFDFGDAPASYGTSYTYNQATGPTLGVSRDAEATGQPSEYADGDGADEDGVSFSPLVMGLTATATISVNGIAGNTRNSLSGWIDFNRDGDFEDAGEKIISRLVTISGSYRASFAVPNGWLEPFYARFRLSKQVNLGSTGAAPDGEVEDYVLNPEIGKDYGDAPATYGTLTASNGATGPRLGANRDVEATGQPSLNAKRDGADEDGVLQGDGTSTGPFRTINLASGVAKFTVAMDIPVSPSGNPVYANLMVWIDWAHDGTFDELDRVFVDPSAFSENGSRTFTVPIPPSIAILGLTYARFRLSQDFSGDSTAPLVDGETEDYAVTITNVVAVADTAVATEDQTFATRINVLANDTILAGTKTFLFDTRPAGGTLTRFTNGNLDPSDDQLDYKPRRNFFGIDTFTYILSDRLGNTSIATVTVNVNSVNDAPANKLPPGPQITPEDTAKTFSAANRNAFSIADVDAGNADVQVSLTATNGTLAIANAAGVTVSGGGSVLVITGTVTQINTSLATGLTFNPDVNYYGLATITIDTNDLGNSGEPPAGLTNPQRDADTVTVNVETLVTINPVTPFKQPTARPTITWQALRGAVSYDVQVNEVTTGSTFVVATSATGTSWTHTADLPIGRYRIMVRGVNAEGVARNWSAKVDFIVAPAPVLPREQSTFDTTPDFGWAAVSGATKYEIIVTQSGAPATIVVQQFTTTNSFIAPPDAAALVAGQYTWKVRAIRTVGTTDYSSEFTANSLLYVGGRPFVKPSTFDSSGMPIFSWLSVAGSSGYEVFVGTAARPGTNLLNAGNNKTSGTTFRYPGALTAGPYVYWVRAFNASTGQASLWSIQNVFTIT